MWGTDTFFVETLAIFTCKTLVFLRENPCSLEKYLRSPETLHLLANLLRWLAKLLRSPEKLFAFKTFVFPQEILLIYKTFVFPQETVFAFKTFVFPQEILRLLAKLLHSAKKTLFTCKTFAFPRETLSFSKCLHSP